MKSGTEDLGFSSATEIGNRRFGFQSALRRGDEELGVSIGDRESKTWAVASEIGNRQSGLQHQNSDATIGALASEIGSWESTVLAHAVVRKPVFKTKSQFRYEDLGFSIVDRELGFERVSLCRGSQTQLQDEEPGTSN